MKLMRPGSAVLRGTIAFLPSSIIKLIKSRRPRSSHNVEVTLRIIAVIVLGHDRQFCVN